MFSRTSALGMFLLFFASILCQAQTATCTNWKFFNLPAPWTSDPHGINRWGTVVGLAQDSNLVNYGYIRYSDGSFKTYMAPNATDTNFARRNALGVTVGFYVNTTATTPRRRGLVVSGASTATVDYPGALHTNLTGINYWGTIVGEYNNQDGSRAGFKLKNGVFTKIKYPGSVPGTTQVNSISDKGVMVGSFQDNQFFSQHGFILNQGVYKKLDNPKATFNGGDGTVLTDINGSGVIVGYYFINSTAYGFIYSNGVFKDIKPQSGTWTRIFGINGYGDVTGSTFTPAFIDADYK